jgi:hypothetical protein
VGVEDAGLNKNVGQEVVALQDVQRKVNVYMMKLVLKKKGNSLIALNLDMSIVSNMK